MATQHIIDVVDRTKIATLPAPGPDPIDRAHLARYTMGDRDLELEVLHLFAQQAEKCVATMLHATTAQAWRDAAHGLKGSASAVGAWNVANLAYAAETLDSSNAAQRSATLDAITASLALTSHYIADFV